jgi:glycogen debranching enzyme
MEYRVIKENNVFLMTNKSGDIPTHDNLGLGLYTKDTRFLSRMEIFINETKPILLSSAADENYLATIRLTNEHMEKEGELILWRESLEIERKRLIHNGGYYEQISLTNFFPKAIEFDFSILFDADFHDMFIVRGFQNGDVGKKTGVSCETGKLSIGYMGADEVKRETRISWNEPETRTDDEGKVHFKVGLEPKETKQITFFVAPFINDDGPERLPIEEAINQLKLSYRKWNDQSTQVESDSKLFDKLYFRGVQDLRVLLTDLGYGSFPVAGLPWFAVPFGRDSLIAALQMLPLNPEIARGTLRTLASYQGTKVDEWRDEQPGKIMHEIRYGELANTNQIPFTPYYGTIDATPLFLVLLVEYYHWTEDLDLVRELMPHVERAFEWIDQYGDRDKDTFVEYFQQSSKGIANQGWKDSADSVVHENGDYADAPIALVEVQGYVYQAKSKLAEILRLLQKEEQAAQLEQEAAKLKENFEASFWMEDEQFYAIALDKDKKQVRSVTSNPGHILMSGLASEEREKLVAQRLLEDDLFSGYGIRTMSRQSAGYNPMSYHDGSVWPHDNSMCLLGLGVQGYKEEASKLISGLLKAADGFEYYRLPELFCGYDDGIGYPVPYPVACSPQAWAAGTPMIMLQVMLGLAPNALKKEITLNPSLPEDMNEITVRKIRIAQGHLSLRVIREKSSSRQFQVLILENTTGYNVTN